MYIVINSVLIVVLGYIDLLASQVIYSKTSKIPYKRFVTSVVLYATTIGAMFEINRLFEPETLTRIPFLILVTLVLNVLVFRLLFTIDIIRGANYGTK